MTITMSAGRIVRLCLLTALFAIACGLPDSLRALIDVLRSVAFPAS